MLARLSPHVAEGLRTALLVGNSHVTSPSSDGPGLLLLADDLSLVAITPAAEAWLAEVAVSDWRSSLELPDAVYAVAARLLALERGDHTPPDLMPRIRLRTASGRWLVLHASRLRAAESEGRIWPCQSHSILGAAKSVTLVFTLDSEVAGRRQFCTV